MSFPERPPLPSITYEQIKMLLHKVDERHWPQITAMRVKSYYPADTPVPPQAPEHLRHQIHWYASMLFKTEADQYEQFQSDARYGSWLSTLADRVTARVMKSLETLENADTNAMHNLLGIHGGLIMGYHGLTTQGVEEELRTLLSELCGQYEIGIAPGQPSSPKTKPASSPPSLKQQQPEPFKVEKPRRMPATVHSPSAAVKMETFMDLKGLGQTEFAIQANTTDKTIRKFRQTGKIKRSILAEIAKAMGTTKEDLLS